MMFEKIKQEMDLVIFVIVLFVAMITGLIGVKIHDLFIPVLSGVAMYVCSICIIIQCTYSTDLKNLRWILLGIMILMDVIYLLIFWPLFISLF